MPEFIKELSFRRILDSLKLTPKHRLVEFGDIWAEIFLWCFMTSIVVHLIATIVAIISLRSHKIGRWYAIFIILAGIITPIIPSALTRTKPSGEGFIISQLCLKHAMIDPPPKG
ncbi:unnamed protein product [Rotaria sp. Silwood2]|nr:unnamed protein product [Rotaria sp. Silwood2]